MSIDPSIALGVKPVQIESPVNALAQLLQVQNAQQQNQLGQMKLDEHQRGIERTNRLQALLGSFTPDAKADDQVGALTRGGFLPEARSLAESSAKVAADKRAAEKAELEGHLKRFEVAGQIMNGVNDQASWDRARAQTAQIFGQEAAAQMPELYDPAQIEQKRMQALTVKDQLEQMWKQKGYDLELKKADEQARHNGAVEKNAAGQLAVSQGQLGVAQAREKREATAPKGQIVQTDTGPLLVDPVSGTATPVTVGGKAVPAKGSGQAAKDAQSVIDLLDQADPLLDTATHSLIGAGYDRGAAAFGKSTEGAQAAAQLKALEGALISKQPKMTGPQSDKDVLLYRQMAGQIGDASLPIETRRAAMRGVREMAKRSLGQPPESANSTKPAAPPPKNAKGWTLHVDAKGNKAYVSPNGKDYEEVH